jgi:hypothetical protein
MAEMDYTHEVEVNCHSDLGMKSTLLGRMKRLVGMFKDSNMHEPKLVREKFRNTLRPIVNNGIVMRDLKDAMLRKQRRDEEAARTNKPNKDYIHKNVKILRRINRRKTHEDSEDSCLHPTEHSTNMKEYDFLYLIVSRPILKVDKFIDEMTDENYEYLTSKLNPDYVSRLTTSLVKLKKYKKYRRYGTIIDVYVNIIEMIFLNVNLKKTLTNTINDAAQYKADSEILRNTDKLNEYLDKIKKIRGKLIPDFDINLKLEYKKKYRIYIKKYGFPKNKIFDPELMLEIENNLSDSDCE